MNNDKVKTVSFHSVAKLAMQYGFTKALDAVGIEHDLSDTIKMRNSRGWMLAHNFSNPVGGKTFPALVKYSRDGLSFGYYKLLR